MSFLSGFHLDDFGYRKLLQSRFLFWLEFSNNFMLIFRVQRLVSRLWTPHYLSILLSAHRMHSMSTRNHYLSGTISSNHTFTFFEWKETHLYCINQKFIRKQFVDLLQVSSRVACTTVDTFQDQSWTEPNRWRRSTKNIETSCFKSSSII